MNGFRKLSSIVLQGRDGSIKGQAGRAPAVKLRRDGSGLRLEMESMGIFKICFGSRI